MSEQEKPVGKLFTHVYLERGEPHSDSQLFRARLGAYVQSELYTDHWKLRSYLKKETGLDVPFTPLQGMGGTYTRFEDFFNTIELKYLLNVITLIWRFLWDEKKKYQMMPNRSFDYVCPPANDWLVFVRRVIKEENIAYRVDDNCGLHYLVDEEFQNSQVALLACLNSSDYTGARDAVEKAYQYATQDPIDTKASLRSMFEAIEIVTKMMCETKNLNKWVVTNTLKDLALQCESYDSVAQNVVSQTFDGFAEWVDAMQNYRHGQKSDGPAAPPIDFTIYALGSGASFLRWLVSIKERTNPSA